MDYERIILDMLNRICALEAEVNLLKSKDNNTEKVRTSDIEKYILEFKQNLKLKGHSYVVIVANDLHKELGLKNRMPMVCNAMRKVMLKGDEILHQTESGNSSTLKIKYYL